MRHLTLKTRDRHRIAAVHHANGFSRVVMLAHGFFNNKDVHLFRELARQLSAHYDVVAFDFRGHGKSSGLFSWTSRESADMEAVLGYVKGCHYEAVGLMGFSLGAALSLIAAAKDRDITTVIAVSAPYDFWQIDYHFWELGMWADLRLNLGYKGRGKGVRPGNPMEPKTAPIDIVDRIAPRPALFIHGSDDWLINQRHSKELFLRAKEPKRLEIIKGGGHAEKLFDDHPQEFMRICLAWFQEVL